MNVVCCKSCYDEISSHSEMTARMWLDLCAHYVHLAGTLLIREERVPYNVPQLKLLERLGFITSMDSDPAVKVRVNGYDIMELKSDDTCVETFCLDRVKHSHEWRHTKSGPEEEPLFN